MFGILERHRGTHTSQCVTAIVIQEDRPFLQQTAFPSLWSTVPVMFQEMLLTVALLTSPFGNSPGTVQELKPSQAKVDEGTER